MRCKTLTILSSLCLLTALGPGGATSSAEAKDKPASASTATAQAAQGEYTLTLPFGLDESAKVVPADNPLAKDKIELGRLLFVDKRLSKNNTIACASCHLPQFAFTDGKRVSTGINGLKGGRSAPASFNRLFSAAQFWDGRADTLEAQSVGPFVSPVEHGFANHDEMIAKMKKIAGYRKLFKEVFGTDIRIDKVGMAIASFQRTV
ncbi:MAG: cytochrome-c peroxidase, partial [Nitrospiraceae bacterium]